MGIRPAQMLQVSAHTGIRGKEFLSRLIKTRCPLDCLGSGICMLDKSCQCFEGFEKCECCKTGETAENCGLNLTAFVTDYIQKPAEGTDPTCTFVPNKSWIRFGLKLWVLFGLFLFGNLYF
jgi:hypothetical protein